MIPMTLSSGLNLWAVILTMICLVVILKDLTKKAGNENIEYNSMIHLFLLLTLNAVSLRLDCEILHGSYRSCVSSLMIFSY